MVAAKEFIVAIELGSSKITGIAGKKNLDGSITVLAVVQENAAACIHRGVIYNIDKTMTSLINIRQRLETLLATKVRRVYVGVGGQSIVGMKNVIVKEMYEETKVTPEVVNELMDINRNMSYPDREILDAITLEYRVDNSLQIDPVGIPCKKLEGNFLNILCRRAFFKNLNRCFKDARIDIAELYLAPLTLAESVLVEADRRAGCVLVDLGAETTTVAVYCKNILRHLAVIPLGGSTITRDIATLQMEEDEAEKMKLKYASAYTEPSDIDGDLVYPLSDGRTVESRKFIEIVEARIEEIVENVWFQVPAEYVDKLLGGIILTGGGANMKNIDKVFRNHTRIEKIRIAKAVNQTVDATQPEVNAHDCRLCTVMSLLAKGDMNCAGEAIGSNLFAQGDSSDGDSSSDNDARGSRQGGSGKVITEEERQRKEEEERLRKEAEERQRAEAEQARLEEERQRKREQSVWYKLRKGIVNFFEGAIAEEE